MGSLRVDLRSYDLPIQACHSVSDSLTSKLCTMLCLCILGQEVLSHGADLCFEEQADDQEDSYFIEFADQGTGERIATLPTVGVSCYLPSGCCC